MKWKPRTTMEEAKAAVIAFAESKPSGPVDGSPLDRQYGSATVDGLEWRDATAYSQGGSKVPNTWQARIPYSGSTRLVIARKKDGSWKACSYSPETSTWVFGAPTPEAAAAIAMRTIAAWLRGLAADITPEVNSDLTERP